jgi:hypothetical protein
MRRITAINRPLKGPFMPKSLLSDLWRLNASLVLAGGVAFVSSCGSVDPDSEVSLDLYEAGLRRLFEDDVVSAHPSDKEFFAISLKGNADPPSALLRRLDSLATEVVPYSKAKTHPARRLTGEGFDRAGLYFNIERVQWVTSSHAVIHASVGSGGLGAVYRLELRRTSGDWECRTLKQIAVS